jgi:Family of unknown function (DUF5764)
MEVLVEAERKYTAKLAGAMIPVMIDAFFDLYAEAKKQSNGRKTLIQFQALLVEIKNWNNSIVKQHTDAIIKTCSMFANLLAAVFVISVKIMSAVRISTESKKLNIKLPTNDVFVHSCYIAAAKDLYENPFIVSDDSKDPDKRAQMTQRFTKCIKDVIEDFIPVQQILETYIPSFTGGELDVDQGAGPDPADCDETTDPTPLEAAEALPSGDDTPSAPPASTEETPSAPEAAAEANTEAAAVPEVADTSAEVKKVPVHHETLFDDAPDKK